MPAPNERFATVAIADAPRAASAPFLSARKGVARAPAKMLMAQAKRVSARGDVGRVGLR